MECFFSKELPAGRWAARLWSLRHEVVDVAVMLSKERHHLLFCQQYPTSTCVMGNGEV